MMQPIPTFARLEKTERVVSSAFLHEIQSSLTRRSFLILDRCRWEDNWNKNEDIFLLTKGQTPGLYKIKFTASEDPHLLVHSIVWLDKCCSKEYTVKVITCISCSVYIITILPLLLVVHAAFPVPCFLLNSNCSVMIDAFQQLCYSKLDASQNPCKNFCCHFSTCRCPFIVFPSICSAE